MRFATVIQARMGSSRLPGKVLLTLADRPVLQWVYERAAAIPRIDFTVVATSTAAMDDVVARWCARKGIPVFRGDERDVLDRYVVCARTLAVDAVVRVTADCPFLDPTESARVVDAFRAVAGCDYASNVKPRTFPRGLDTEVIHRSALEAAWSEASAAADREHVTTSVTDRPERFKAVGVCAETDLSRVAGRSTSLMTSLFSRRSPTSSFRGASADLWPTSLACWLTALT